MVLASCFFPLPPPPPPRLSGCCSSPRGACYRSHSAAAATATSPPSSGALDAILSSRIIACLRAQDADTAMEAACAALSSGISVLEIVMSTPGVLEVVKELLNRHPSSVIGVGTVLNAEDARKAVEAGAGFLMSPGTVMEILLDHHNNNVLYIPGAMTPTEVLFAYNTGARIVKIYPVSILGGERYISALKKSFPHIPMVASQGITIDTIGKYIGCGVSAVVLSDAIFEKKAMARRDFKEICRLAHLATLQAFLQQCCMVHLRSTREI